MLKLGLALVASLSAMQLGVGSAPAIEITQVRGKFSCPELDNQQECAIKFEKIFLEAHPEIVVKENGRLKIKLTNGDFTFVPNKDSLKNVLELQAHERFLVIREGFSEGDTWHLLDRSTGKRTEVHGYSLFSPDESRFVVASEDETGMSDTVFDVYEVSPLGIRRTFRALNPREPGWSARNPSWVGNARVQFSRSVASESSPTGSVESPAYLSLKNGGWQVYDGRPK